MRYLIVSDLHGRVSGMLKLLTVLERRGWTMLTTEDNHPVLHHPDETLIVAGDSSDRGDWSLPVQYLMASSWSQAAEIGLGPAVLPLLGNHDERITRWMQTGYNNPAHGFVKTLAQLNGEAFKKQRDLVVQVVPEYPLHFVGKTFLAVHAFWEDPKPAYNLAIRGPTTDGYRRDWWHEFEQRDKAVFFGHYHGFMDMMWPEKRLYCIDNLDASVLTYAVIDDEVPNSERVRQQNMIEQTKLYATFKKLCLPKELLVKLPSVELIALQSEAGGYTQNLSTPWRLADLTPKTEWLD